MKRSPNKRIKGLGVLICLVILGSAGLIAANRLANNRLRQIVNSPLPNNQIGVLGKSYAAEDYELKLKQIQSYPVDDVTSLKRVTATILITNTSNDVLQISPGLQLSLKESNGKIHMATARYQPGGQVIGGPVEPESTIVISVDFEISQHDQPDKLIFQLDIQDEPTEVNL